MLRWLDAVPVKWWLLSIVGLVLAVSAIFGGLADAEKTAAELPTVPAGEEFVGPQLTTILRVAMLADSAPRVSSPPDDGNTYLVVTATVTNTWRVTTTSLADLLTLQRTGDGVEVAVDRVVLLADGSSLPQANPGVPIDVAFVWQVPADEIATGDTVRVSIASKTLTEDGDVTYGSYWSNPIPAGASELVVTR